MEWRLRSSLPGSFANARRCVCSCWVLFTAGLDTVWQQKGEVCSCTGVGETKCATEGGQKRVKRVKWWVVSCFVFHQSFWLDFYRSPTFRQCYRKESTDAATVLR